MKTQSEEMSRKRQARETNEMEIGMICIIPECDRVKGLNHNMFFCLRLFLFFSLSLSLRLSFGHLFDESTAVRERQLTLLFTLQFTLTQEVD